jgi:hypothetical protein
MPLISAGYPEGFYGVGVREPFTSEDTYFKDNPHVGGMAAEDNKIIINPYSKLSDKEKQSVMLNEAARVHMRTGLYPPPNFDVTPEQAKSFATYSKDPKDIQHTIAARILSGDPSAGVISPAQQEYAKSLGDFMGVK